MGAVGARRAPLNHCFVLALVSLPLLPARLASMASESAGIGPKR